jgi:hypothetical protein
MNAMSISGKGRISTRTSVDWGSRQAGNPSLVPGSRKRRVSEHLMHVVVARGCRIHDTQVTMMLNARLYAIKVQLLTLARVKQPNAQDNSEVWDASQAMTA